MKHHIGSITAVLVLSAGLLGTDLHGYEGESGQSVSPHLERALRETGWSVDRLADGGLKLHLARPVPPPPAPTDTTQLQTPLTEAAAWERLRERGWRVERAADGSLLLFPGKKSTVEQPLAESSPETASPDTPQVEHASKHPQQTPASPEEIDELLRQRGWRANRAPDGSLLVYPLAGKNP